MTPAQINFRAPRRLVDWLAKEGFAVELSVTRATSMTIDPGADAADLDAEIDEQDQKNIEGTIAAYDATAGALDVEPPAGGESEAA